MAVIVFGFWYICQRSLNTEYPALAVASGSMLPTLNIGDVIIVQGITADQINAEYITGDIVVFKSPRSYDPYFRIVHRAVKVEKKSDGYWITTHGDNNPLGSEEKFHERDLIGKVIAKIPYVGNVSLLVNSVGNFYFFTIIVIAIISILFSLLFDTEGEKNVKKGAYEEKKLFGKLDIKTVKKVFSITSFIVLNALLIGFIIFGLFGSFTFWQIGSDPPTYVTLRGMYPELQYITSFKINFNNVHNASLSNGFLTYSIDCFVSDGAHEGVRLGVPTFSWMQASIFVLIAFNGWTLAKYFIKSKNLLKRKTKPNAL